MQYLNRRERRLFNAMGQYAPRRLTQIERIIKHLVTVHGMPASNEELRAAKASEATQAVRILEGLTSNETLLERAKKALHSTAALHELVESYPYVEFESLINNTAPLPPLVYAAYRGLMTEELIAVAEWYDKFMDLVNELPTQFGEVYIWTPRTHNAMLRQMAIDEKEKAAWGLVLRKDLQDRVNELFKDGHFYNHPLRLIHEYNLDKIPDLRTRLGLESPDVAGKPSFNHSLTFWVKESKRGSIITDRELSARTVSVNRTDYPVLSQADVKTLFHFQY